MLGRINRITRSQVASGYARPIISNSVTRVNLKSKTGCISKNGFLVKEAEHIKEKNRQRDLLKILSTKVKPESKDLQVVFFDNSNLDQFKYNLSNAFNAQTTILEMNLKYFKLQKKEKEKQKYDNLQLKNMIFSEYASHPFYADALFIDYFASLEGNSKTCPRDDLINLVKNQQASLFVLGINLSTRGRRDKKMRKSKLGEKNKTERRIEIVTAEIEQIFARAGLRIIEKNIGKRYNENHMCARFYLLERSDSTEPSDAMDIDKKFIGPLRQAIDLTQSDPIVIDLT